MTMRESDREKYNAHVLVSKAIRRGEMVPPSVCSVCGIDVVQYHLKYDGSNIPHANPKIVAHHWRGYAYPLDIWWVCTSCNYHLPHDGESLDTVKEWQKKGWRFEGEDTDEMPPLPPVLERVIDHDLVYAQFLKYGLSSSEAAKREAAKQSH